MSLTTLPDGSKAIVDGVFTYRIDDDGKLLALRAYWETGALRLVPPGSPP